MGVILVVAILAVLMFELGLNLTGDDFRRVLRQPAAVAIAMLGQLVILPLMAFLLARAFELPPVLFAGLVLVACCPGGSSSNIFSRLASGDVALSVTLTALSSVVTLFTLPLIMAYVMNAVPAGSLRGVSFPLGPLLAQNLVTVAVPIALGMLTRRWRPILADTLSRRLAKGAFPALVLVAVLFFLQNRAGILNSLNELFVSVTELILVAILVALMLAMLAGQSGRARRTIVIEVGMQNAAQAIALASSPLVFNSELMAMPAIMYAMMMNVILLTYVWAVRHLFVRREMA